HIRVPGDLRQSRSGSDEAGDQIHHRRGEWPECPSGIERTRRGPRARAEKRRSSLDERPAFATRHRVLHVVLHPEIMKSVRRILPLVLLAIVSLTLGACATCHKKPTTPRCAGCP